MGYSVRFCRCGRIHAIDTARVDKALENDKDLLLICGGCGVATLIGGDTVANCDGKGNNGYLMYATTFSHNSDASIGTASFESEEGCKGIEEIVYSHGIRVPMKTGEYANSYHAGRFYDSSCPELWKIQRRNVTAAEVIAFVDEYQAKSRIVNMEQFIHETPEELLNAISAYAADGLDWSGTKWDYLKQDTLSTLEKLSQEK